MVTKKDGIGTDLRWILSKMQNYCGYQERCIQDIKNKLTGYNLQERTTDKVISLLISENYVNEDRYAKMFVSGKFRIKKWGKNKIIRALQDKGIPDIYIQIALREIDDDEYLTALRLLIAQKNNELTETDINKRNRKLANFAISKGYEAAIVWDILHN